MAVKAMAGAVFEIPVVRVGRAPVFVAGSRTTVSRRRRQVSPRCRRVGRAV
nr:hypothetical protein [Propionicimonas sp.]